MSQYSLLTIPPYHFLIPLHQLKEVQLTPNISPVPQAPSYVLGLFPIRGKLCTLLCLSTLLNFTNKTHSFSKIIILDHDIGLFALEVVDIDIDVQHALVVLEKLEDGQDDVVGVAEARGLWNARQRGVSKGASRLRGRFEECSRRRSGTGST